MVVKERLGKALETNAIQNRMEEVRCDLDEDVQHAVEGVRAMGSWRSYVKAYPWLFLGAAFAAGYLVMRRPRLQSQPKVESQPIAQLQPKAQLRDEQVDPSRPVDAPSLPTKSSTRDRAVAIVGNLVVRGVLSYVGDLAGRLIAKHTKTINDK